MNIGVSAFTPVRAVGLTKVVKSTGNFVIVRSTGKRDWEDMPIYARVGMHLLFHGPAQVHSSPTWMEYNLTCLIDTLP